MATLPTSKTANQPSGTFTRPFRRRRFSRRPRDEKDGIEYETLSIGREAEESAEKWRSCDKNPGHFSFIPACDFGMQHLPDGDQHESVLQYIQAVSALTVRLRVNHTSPRLQPNEGVSTTTTTPSSRTGTGYIRDIRSSDESCRCTSCRSSDQAIPKCWFVDVMTAQHVVYDSDEARFTLVDVLMEDGSLVTLRGSRVMGADGAGDWCQFCCVTHDQGVAEKIENLLQQLGSAREKLSALESGVSDTVVIVSYPHGQPRKQITVGKLRNTRFHSYPQSHDYIGDRDIPTSKLHVVHGFWWRAWMEHTYIGYDTDTCSGSSGAPVILLTSPSFSRETSDTRFLPVHFKGWGPLGWNTGSASLQSIHDVWLQIVSPRANETTDTIAGRDLGGDTNLKDASQL